MTMQCTQQHEFSYLHKKYGKDNTFEVMEIPGIIIGGKDLENMKDEIVSATKDYLDSNESIHYQAQKRELTSTLTTSDMGVVVGIEKFFVECD